MTGSRRWNVVALALRLDPTTQPPTDLLKRRGAPSSPDGPHHHGAGTFKKRFGRAPTAPLLAPAVVGTRLPGLCQQHPPGAGAEQQSAGHTTTTTTRPRIPTTSTPTARPPTIQRHSPLPSPLLASRPARCWTVTARCRTTTLSTGTADAGPHLAELHGRPAAETAVHGCP